jgi:hypothetical protein
MFSLFPEFLSYFIHVRFGFSGMGGIAKLRTKESLESRSKNGS